MDACDYNIVIKWATYLILRIDSFFFLLRQSLELIPHSILLRSLRDGLLETRYKPNVEMGKLAFET